MERGKETSYREHATNDGTQVGDEMEERLSFLYYQHLQQASKQELNGQSQKQEVLRHSVI